MLIGGGLSVAINILKVINRHCSNCQILIVVPECKHYSFIDNSNIDVISIPLNKLKRSKRVWLDNIYLKRIINRFNPELVFNLANLPLPTKREQILLFDNPFTTADTLNGLNLTFREKLTHYMRNMMFMWRSRHIDMFLVQTEVQQQRLIKRLRNNTPVKYLPNASANITTPVSVNIPTEADRVYYLAFTRYYSHKNLEILIDVAKLFRDNNINKTIILTIDKSQGKKAEKILLKIKKLKLEKYIFTIGRVDFNQIASLYSKVDALILPTLLESYSSTYADAMLYRKIIYTSNRDFAHEVCKDSAFYFNPLSGKDIYNTIIESDKNQELIEYKKLSGSKVAGNSVNWEESILSLFNDLRIKL